MYLVKKFPNIWLSYTKSRSFYFPLKKKKLEVFFSTLIIFFLFFLSSVNNVAFKTQNWFTFPFESKLLEAYMKISARQRHTLQWGKSSLIRALQVPKDIQGACGIFLFSFLIKHADIQQCSSNWSIQTHFITSQGCVAITAW